jgi:hypothetical protein
MLGSKELVQSMSARQVVHSGAQDTRRRQITKVESSRLWCIDAVDREMESPCRIDDGESDGEEFWSRALVVRENQSLDCFGLALDGPLRTLLRFLRSHVR